MTGSNRECPGTGGRAIVAPRRGGLLSGRGGAQRLSILARDTGFQPVPSAPGAEEPCSCRPMTPRTGWKRVSRQAVRCRGGRIERARGGALAACVGIALVVATLAGPARAADRPNILFIVTDD